MIEKKVNLEENEFLRICNFIYTYKLRFWQFVLFVFTMKFVARWVG